MSPHEELQQRIRLLEKENRRLKKRLERSERNRVLLEESNERHKAMLRTINMELKATNEKLKQVDEMKTNFLSMVSHELRTPLTSILGFTQIIRKRFEQVILPNTDLSDKKSQKAAWQIRQNLEVIIKESRRLSELINDVLDIAKIESGRVEWKEEDTDMKAIFERAIAATEALIHEKGLYLRREYKDDSFMLKGDPDRLIQVVTNLLSNAIKFTDSGGIICRISKEGDVIRCEVEDTGCGIPEDMLEKVFEKFKQVGDTLTERPKGTGLGLPICREIIKHHRGRIWAESQLGKGSRFIFELPATTMVAKKTIKRDILHRIQEHIREKEGGKILIVDDDPFIRGMVRQFLEDKGYTIEEAEDAKEAIGKTRSSRPDLIILDIMMPGLSGYDVLRVLKNDELTSDIPVLVLSVLENKQKALMLGASEYITKPFDEKDLYERIQKILSHHGQKERIMIIDRDISLMRQLSQFMRSKGYEVIECRPEPEEVKNGLKSAPERVFVDIEATQMLLQNNSLAEALSSTKVVFICKVPEKRDSG